MGTEELENSIKDTIQHYLDYLGFDNSQLILSGMSMGTFPSMYYGADFEPHAIIMSKPLANVGTIGNRARLLAPEVFPTGIDVLHLQTGRLDNEGVEALNQKFWDKFEKADFSNTTFGLSYMKDEDMDPTAYEDITKSLYYSGAKILSKGTSGRHNDDSYTATTWFVCPSHNGVARVFCDVCTPDRKPFAGDPRDALDRKSTRLNSSHSSVSRMPSSA